MRALFLAMFAVLTLGVFCIKIVADDPPPIPVRCPDEGLLCDMEVMTQSNPGCAYRENHANTECKICERNAAGTIIQYCVATSGPTAGCTTVPPAVTCGLKLWGECQLLNGIWKCVSTNRVIEPCEMKSCAAEAIQDL
jgi:hypothetical protein